MVLARPDKTLELSPSRVSELGETPRLRVAQWAESLSWLLIPMTLGVAITHQSLWVDEGFTVWFADHRTFSSFCSALIGSPGAPGDPQLGGYLLYMWSWTKIFGESEFALRAANIPFALVFLAATSWAAQKLLDRPNLWIFFCLSPFFWLYLNEARPYAALMAFASVAIVALLAYLGHPRQYAASAPWLCLMALLFAWGSHILGAFLFPSMIVLAALTALSDTNVRQNFLRDWRRPALWLAPVFLAFGSFQAWASTYGVNREHGKPGLRNLTYALYEFFGFDGLGPPRMEIREHAGVQVFAPYWPWLALGATTLIVTALLLFRKRPPRLVCNLLISLVIGLAIALGFSIHEHFQVLARHLAVFYPFLLLTLMLWTRNQYPSRRWQHAAVSAMVALAIVWGTSDIRLSRMSKYSKDDYRGAAAIAESRALTGEKILWAADPHTAHYYGIEVRTGDRSAEIGSSAGMALPVRVQALDGQNLTLATAMEYLDSATTPTLLVLSKADLFDMHGAWRTLIEQRHPQVVARLAAFTLYEWLPRG